MSIEQHVTSLEISKKLKYLGVKQESQFEWVKMYSFNEYKVLWKPTLHYETESYSAFLASELGELLPSSVKTHRSFDNPREWAGFVSGFDRIFRNKQESNLRGEILIYLLENNLLST